MDIFKMFGRVIIDDAEAKERIDEIDESGRKLDRGIGKLGKSFMKFNRDTSRGTKKLSVDFDKLPEHLKPLHTELNQTHEDSVKGFRNVSQSLDEMAESASKAVVETRKMTSISDTGEEATKVMQELNEVTRNTRLAIMGLSKDGKVKLSTEESVNKIKEFQEETQELKERLEALKDAGDFGSYTAGMNVYHNKLREVNNTFAVVSKGGMGYYSMLSEMGVHTEQMANHMGVQMEGYKDRFLRSVDMMQNKSTVAEKIGKNFDKLNTPFKNLDKSLLGVSDRLEHISRQGAPAQAALNILGPTASMKDLLDQIRLINTGLMRWQQLTIGLGVVAIGSTVAMVKMSNIVDGRLIPAFDKFKSTWLDALEPFIRGWTTFAKGFIDFGTKLGEIVNTFSEAHPVITQMIGMFMYLLPIILLLLAPMAIMGNRATGLAIAFRFVYMMIKPFIDGLLMILPRATLITGAIVALGTALVQMWKHSEDFRNSVIGLWEAFKNAVATATAPLLAQWNILKAALLNLLSTVFGTGNTWTDVWKKIGDATAVVVNWISQNLMPLLGQTISVGIDAIVFVLNGLIWVIQEMTRQWIRHKDQIIPVVKNLMSSLSQTFTGIVTAISGAVKLIAGIFNRDWKQALEGAKKIAEGVFNAILGIIKSIFPNYTKEIDGFVKKVKSGFEKVVGYGKDLVDFFAGMKIELPDIKLPHFSLKGEFSLKKMTVPTVGVDWYRNGGIFSPNSPQLIGVGDHPSAPEAALPLTDKVLGAIGASIAQLMPQPQAVQGGGWGTGDIVIQIGEYEIARATMPHIDKMQGARSDSKARFKGVRTV